MKHNLPAAAAAQKAAAAEKEADGMYFRGACYGDYIDISITSSLSFHTTISQGRGREEGGSR